jgi:hypothetical protein
MKKERKQVAIHNNRAQTCEWELWALKKDNCPRAGGMKSNCPFIG